MPTPALRSTRAVSLGAEPADPADGAATLDVPAIKGIGGSLIYFVDRYGAKGSLADCGFAWTGDADPHPVGAGQFYIDHLTHNVQRGRMGVWSGFYERLFNFREIRFFAINGRIYRPALARADQPGRPHPHPHQRERRCEQPDRGIPARL